MPFKAGDQIVIVGIYGKRQAVVSRIVKGGYVNVNGINYNQDGSCVGGSNKQHIELLTPELEEEIRHEKTIKTALELINGIDNTNLDYVTAVKLVEVLGGRVWD